jgi:thiosulfate reductase cytochrome b subunit
MSEKIYLHTMVERIWHWTNGFLIILLVLTGMQLHWPDTFTFFGAFSNAVLIHNWSGILLIIDFFVWLIYNIVSKRISHYILKKEEIYPGLIVQAKYYLYGIFKREPHPYTPTENNKFNPLQKLAYFVYMFIFMPLLLLSGILYLYPECSSLILKIGGLKTIAIFHFIMAFVFTAFLIIHLYLSTTGDTIFSSLISMFTGYEEKKEH